MRGKKSARKLKILAVIIIVAAAGAFFFLRKNSGAFLPSPRPKHEAGYKKEDRHKLEKLIHEETKND